MTRDTDYRAGNVFGEDTSGIVQRIKELAQRCEALEASNSFLAAQLAEVNGAWRDAIVAIADSEQPASAPAMRELAAQSTGLRQHIFSEMAGILEQRKKTVMSPRFLTQMCSLSAICNLRVIFE